MKERVSALIDNALEDSAVESVLDTVRKDRDVVRAWDTYHLIGESLRGESNLGSDVAARVMASLESEPTVVAPKPRLTGSTASMRWALPLAASVMGVGAVAWVAQSLNGPGKSEEVVQIVTPSAATRVATMPKPVIAPQASIAQATIAPVQEDFGREYLIAHQAYSPGANMSGVAQYVRTVSESRGEPAR